MRTHSHWVNRRWVFPFEYELRLQKVLFNVAQEKWDYRKAWAQLYFGGAIENEKFNWNWSLNVDLCACTRRHTLVLEQSIVDWGYFQLIIFPLRLAIVCVCVVAGRANKEFKYFALSQLHKHFSHTSDIRTHHFLDAAIEIVILYRLVFYYYYVEIYGLFLCRCSPS